MSENKESIDKPVKKAPAKKAAVKKTVIKTNINENNLNKDNDYTIIVFDSGTAYVSGDYYFTKENRIREIPSSDAVRLLELDNFRLADQLEIEEYLASRED